MINGENGPAAKLNLKTNHSAVDKHETLNGETDHGETKNLDDQEKSEEIPSPPPPNHIGTWRMYFCPQSDIPFYHNAVQGRGQWEIPSGVPVENLDDDSRVLKLQQLPPDPKAPLGFCGIDPIRCTDTEIEAILKDWSKKIKDPEFMLERVDDKTRGFMSTFYPEFLEDILKEFNKTLQTGINGQPVKNKTGFLYSVMKKWKIKCGHPSAQNDIEKEKEKEEVAYQDRKRLPRGGYRKSYRSQHRYGRGHSRGRGLGYSRGFGRGWSSESVVRPRRPVLRPRPIVRPRPVMRPRLITRPQLRSELQPRPNPHFVPRSIVIRPPPSQPQLRGVFPGLLTPRRPPRHGLDGHHPRHPLVVRQPLHAKNFDPYQQYQNFAAHTQQQQQQQPSNEPIKKRPRVS
eukprot:g2535.t1